MENNCLVLNREEGKSVGLTVYKGRQAPSLVLTCCVVLGKELPLSKPQFPHNQNRRLDEMIPQPLSVPRPAMPFI